jgi:nitrogenase molybdenum-iron protein alpha/beta subunit
MARRPGLAIREKRLQGISAYLDAPAPLLAEFAAGEAVQRIRTFSQVTPDDVTAALGFLGGIRGAAIVVHAPRGCAASLLASAPQAAWAVTGLDQRDTIMGSGPVLAQTVRALVDRHQPWVVFIVGGPVVAINSDDARAVVAELTEELCIPILAVRTDGFRSRIAATGWDAAVQAVLPLVPQADGPAEADLVNLITLSADAAAGVGDVLASLGLEANSLPAGADASGFARAGQARLSVALDPDAGAALAAGLDAAYGVKALHLPPPIGLAATASWLRMLADATGRKERAAALPVPTAEPTLQGARVHVALPPAVGFAAAVLVGELGGTVVGLTVDYLDASHARAAEAFAARHPDVQLHVAAGQPFEVANLLAQQRPDLFLGPPALAALASAAGIAALGIVPDTLVGAPGAAWLARAARKALRNPAFARRLAGGALPYTAGWYRRSADWHIKQEVR